MAMRLVNIGCGDLFHPDWINVDLSAKGACVVECDIRRGLPFDDGSVDACYSSHLLEHLTPADARALMLECHRVLKVGGISRVVVPDMEAVARHYLDALAAARQGGESAEANYNWMAIELLDQLVRERGGGEMAPFLRGAVEKDRPFIRQRVGLQAGSFWGTALAPRRGLLRKLRDKGTKGLIGKIRESAAIGCATILLGQRGRRALEVGLFRCSGEVHKWMYDRHSMGRLLRECGFTGVTDRLPGQSHIHDFSRYELDTTGGVTIKANSLFLEARKD